MRPPPPLPPPQKKKKLKPNIWHLIYNVRYVLPVLYMSYIHSCSWFQFIQVLVIINKNIHNVISAISWWEQVTFNQMMMSGLFWPKWEPTTYHTQGDHVNNYTTNVVYPTTELPDTFIIYFCIYMCFSKVEMHTVFFCYKLNNC